MSKLNDLINLIDTSIENVKNLLKDPRDNSYTKTEDNIIEIGKTLQNIDTELRTQEETKNLYLKIYMMI